MSKGDRTGSDDVAVVIFVKYPIAGKVKTRLAASIGQEAAATAYRRMVECVIGALPAAMRKFVHVSPPDKLRDTVEWLGGKYGAITAFFPQSGGTLGDRMLAAARKTLEDGFRKVLIIGTDCLDISPAILLRAADILEHVDVVLGPAADGGYYLIGMRATDGGMFLGVEWSNPETRRQTEAAVKRCGMDIHVLDTVLVDIDTGEEWEKYRHRLV